MKNILMGFGAAVTVAFLGLGAPAASASPLIGVQQISPRPDVLTQVQYIERGRVIHPVRRVCRVETIRRRTPRGVVVERVRRCFR